MWGAKSYDGVHCIKIGKWRQNSEIIPVKNRDFIYLFSFVNRLCVIILNDKLMI